MNPAPIQRVSPESAGFKSEDVAECIRAIQHKNTHMHSFIAARDGKIFAECYWDPFSRELVHSNHSLGKSYTCTAILFLIQDGLLSEEDLIVDLFREDIESRGITPDENMKKMRLRDVMAMATGMERMPMIADDWIGNFLSAPVKYEPGTRFYYNTAGSCMLGAIVKKVSGKDLKEFLTERLFTKIGIDPQRFVWLKFPDGYDAEPGTFSCTEDNLRLAMLYTNLGKWNGEQILDSDLVRRALSVQTENADNPDHLDWRSGYGYQLWACSFKGAYRIDGGQAQYGIIWPEKGLTVAIHEGGILPDGLQDTLDVVFRYLFDKVSDEAFPEDPEARMALLRLCQETRYPDDPANETALKHGFSCEYTVTAGELDPWISLSPSNTGDFFRPYRDNPFDVSSFRLTVAPDGILLELSETSSIYARFDGKLQREITETPFKALGNYAASARFIDEAHLQIHIHWLNGWFETLLDFAPEGDRMQIGIHKTRLDTRANYIEGYAEAVQKKP